MLKKDKPETLIQLLASYQQADFSREVKTKRDLARLAGTIAKNCAVTIYFAGRRIKSITDDGEQFFALCSAQEGALKLKKRCSMHAGRPGSDRWRKEVETLHSEYDILTRSINYMVASIDRDLMGKLDGIL